MATGYGEAFPASSSVQRFDPFRLPPFRKAPPEERRHRVHPKLGLNEACQKPAFVTRRVVTVSWCPRDFGWTLRVQQQPADGPVYLSSRQQPCALPTDWLEGNWIFRGLGSRGVNRLSWRFGSGAVLALQRSQKTEIGHPTDLSSSARRRPARTIRARRRSCSSRAPAGACL